jgi:hypothetical protein
MDMIDWIVEHARDFVLWGAIGLIVAGFASALFYTPWGRFVVRREREFDRRGHRIKQAREGVCYSCLKVLPFKALHHDGKGHICARCRELRWREEQFRG